MSVQNELHNLIEPLLVDLGYELVGVEYHPHSGHSVVRIYADKPETGITLDDCAMISREVSGLLDVHDPVSSRYNLEVSSPGLDRPLFTVAHYEQFIGREAKVSLLAPVDKRRKFTGTIIATDSDMIEFGIDEDRLQVSHGNIAKAKLVPVLD